MLAADARFRTPSPTREPVEPPRAPKRWRVLRKAHQAGLLRLAGAPPAFAVLAAAAGAPADEPAPAAEAPAAEAPAAEAPAAEAPAAPAPAAPAAPAPPAGAPEGPPPAGAAEGPPPAAYNVLQQVALELE